MTGLVEAMEQKTVAVLVAAGGCGKLSGVKEPRFGGKCGMGWVDEGVGFLDMGDKVVPVRGGRVANLAD